MLFFIIKNYMHKYLLKNAIFYFKNKEQGDWDFNLKTIIFSLGIENTQKIVSICQI